MRRKFFLRHLGIYLIPLLIPILILGTLSIIITEQYFKKNINENNISLLKQTQSSMEALFDEVDSLTLRFDKNAKIVNRVKGIFESPLLTPEYIDALDYIRDSIEAPAYAKPYIYSIYIYFTNEQNRFINSVEGLSTFDNFYDRAWYESYTAQKMDTWIEVRNIKPYSFETKDTRVVTIFKKLYSPGMKQTDGVLVLNILPSYVENLLESYVAFRDQDIFILDSNNQIVFKNSGSAVISVQDLPRNSYMISRLDSSKYNLSYISAVPQSTLYSIPRQLLMITLALLFISLILGIGLTYYLTKRNYKQIETIISIIESAERLKPLPSLPTSINDEYDFIINNILKTFIEQSYLKVQLSERKYKLQTAELLALQSQINPHFLYNTLETINWQILGITGSPNVVNTMISNLSTILRYSLGSPGENVIFEKEIKNTQSYIDIQKIRYRDKFHVIWEYEESFLAYPILKLILQPLIENSIYHGIKEKEGPSTIKIKLKRKTRHLEIAVIDDGLGIRLETLTQIRTSLEEDSVYPEHIGLLNINKRLKLTYGSEYGILIRSKYGRGTAIYISIPLFGEAF